MHSLQHPTSNVTTTAKLARCHGSRLHTRRTGTTLPHTICHAYREDRDRETVKKLTRLFYFDKQDGPTRTHVSPSATAKPSDLHISNLPLWRTEWAVLLGCQEFLHVLAPHYVHMFEAIFSKPRPWQFGHLYLPGGSKNLGSPSYQLTSGSQAPLTGVLVRVTRAVRLRDGKFLILATCLARFKVVRCVQELPYSVADVELLEDCELVESFSQQALTAVMQTAGDEVSISSLMAAAGAAAREAASAVAWQWLTGYELAVASKQEWPGPGPREGETDLETHLLVQELMAHGVPEVLPLPDGVVIGRCDLRQVAAAADSALQQAVRSVASSLVAPGGLADSAAGAAVAGAGGPGLLAGALGSSCEGSSNSNSSITSLNTTVDRGVNLQGAELAELTGSSAASSSTQDVLMLEAAVWAQIDTLVALVSRVKGSRHALPFGLLQLRPPPVQPFTAYPAYQTGGSTPAASSPSQSSPSAPAAAAAAAVRGVNEGKGSGDAAGFEGSWVDGLQPPPVAEVVCEGAEDGSISCAPGSSETSSTTSNSSTSSGGYLDASGDAQHHQASRYHQDNSSLMDVEEQQLAAAAKYAYAASDGCDAHADPHWPPLRRAARLSWAAATLVGHTEQDKGEMRQALLEATSIAQRLRFVLAVLSKHVKVLAAVAAVKGVQE